MVTTISERRPHWFAIRRCSPCCGGALLYFGVTPAAALWLIQSMFLCAMGAAGGALAYHIIRSWVGPLLWTVFSCCWPGGDNWVCWVRPLTETGTAACFVIVCWMLSCALREAGGKAITWLLLAGAVAGEVRVQLPGIPHRHFRRRQRLTATVVSQYRPIPNRLAAVA